MATAKGDLTLLQRLRHLNLMLAFIMAYMSMCSFNFGYDVGIFGGVQAMNSFGRRFGEYNETRDAWVIPGWLSSVMTATPFIGKAIGSICCGYIAKRWGRRSAIFCLCIVCIVGVVLQTAAVNSGMFTTGRIITFAMTGMAIVVVPIYNAETSPQVLRGMFSSTIQLMIAFGGLIASCVTYGTKSIDSDAGWRIPTGLQLVMPALLLLLFPLIPESPRWLLSKNRREDALANLRKLRKGATEDELNFEIEALVHSHLNEGQGSWAEVFNAANRIRTAVAVFAMFGQQITGQAFLSQYSVIFYQSQGFGDRSFLFSIISSIISLAGIIFTWLFSDGFGRRPILMIGGSLMGVFLLILGGMGTIDQGSLNSGEKGLMVASLMLFGFFYALSWAPISYVVVSETAALHVKEKTNLLACVISVLTTFVTSFTMPYLINAQYANLGGKVGYIYGSINIVMAVLTYFIIPELKGFSLEEVDQLFASGAPLRKFKTVQTRTAQDIYQDEVTWKDHKGGSKPRLSAVEPS
ncbi:general substrate transporter [Aspergillus pseudoustus]|uniref:General substrate transporter n=1 Tax=Aspergillus pseudoustus TaxID=1810923 RepID=A0ABR4JZL7_9EURO